MDIIDSSGSSPRLRLGALLGTGVATVAYGYWAGLLSWIDATLGGLNGSYDTIGTWISEELLGSLFAIGPNTISAAAASNARWIASLGPAGIVVATIELLVVAYLLLFSINAVERMIGGLISS